MEDLLPYYERELAFLRRYGKEFAERYPKIKVEEDRIFIIDGPIWTSAGMSAGARSAATSMQTKQVMRKRFIKRGYATRCAS